MLVLGRKHNESILIDGPAEITVASHGRTTLVIDAPPETRIVRKELAEKDAANKHGRQDAQGSE